MVNSGFVIQKKIAQRWTTRDRWRCARQEVAAMSGCEGGTQNAEVLFIPSACLAKNEKNAQAELIWTSKMNPTAFSPISPRGSGFELRRGSFGSKQ